MNLNETEILLLIKEEYNALKIERQKLKITH